LISAEFPLEVFTGLLARHLESFRTLEGIQVKALDGMKNQGVEGLAAMMASQQEVLADIAREKAGLRPYLDQWEALQPDQRSRLRLGKAGEILDALEGVAQGIAARHQDWFGADPGGVPAARPDAIGAAAKAADPASAGKESPAPGTDLSQTINIYRALQ
jgi:hypothetical protein